MGRINGGKSVLSQFPSQVDPIVSLRIGFESVRFPILIADDPAIDSGNIKQPEEKRHPVPRYTQLSSIIAPELVRKINSVHLHIIVDCNLRSRQRLVSLVAPSKPNILSIIGSKAWAAALF